MSNKPKPIPETIRAEPPPLATRAPERENAMMRFSCPTCSQIMECTANLVGTNGVCPHCAQRVIVPDAIASTNEPILGKPESESAEAVFAQAAKDYRMPIKGQDSGFLSWLGWAWLPLWIFGQSRR
jgi:hypothetical protein